MFRFFLFLSILFLGLSQAQAVDKQTQKQEVININKVQNVVAPALIPSKSKTLRSAREEAELETESTIIQKLEKDRLKDEQKRLQKMFNQGGQTDEKISESVQKDYSASRPKSYSSKNWLNKGFISVGIGTVNYVGVENVNSTESPAYLFSFGGYGYGHFIFDMSFIYSVHYLIPVDKGGISHERNAVSQPSLAMAVKFSPLKDRIKPYLGLSGAFVGRSWYQVTTQGEYVGDAQIEGDVGVKRWRTALDLGMAIGADIGLGSKLGLNLDLRYYFNVYTETRKVNYNPHIDLLDERNTAVLSANLRYYF